MSQIYGAAAVSPALRLSGAPGLTVIQMAADLGAVRRGSSGAHYIETADSSKWVMKTHFLGCQHTYLCFNEAVSAQIAVRMGVPMPEPAVVELEEEQALALGAPSAADRFAFATRLIDPSEPLTPEAAERTDPAQLAGIAVFDALTGNSNREPEHVLVDTVSLGTWQVWAIDHGHTYSTSNVLGELTASTPVRAPMTLLQRGLRRGLVEPWVTAARSIPRAEFVAMAAGLPDSWVIEPEAPSFIADVLFQRAHDLPALLDPYLS